MLTLPALPQVGANCKQSIQTVLGEHDREKYVLILIVDLFEQL